MTHYMREKLLSFGLIEDSTLTPDSFQLKIRDAGGGFFTFDQTGNLIVCFPGNRPSLPENVSMPKLVHVAHVDTCSPAMDVSQNQLPLVTQIKHPNVLMSGFQTLIRPVILLIGRFVHHLPSGLMPDLRIQSPPNTIAGFDNKAACAAVS